MTNDFIPLDEESVPQKQYELRWGRKASEKLKGKTIHGVAYMTDEMAEELGWYSKPLVIVFTDGSYIFASSDDEGNNAGALFTSFEDLPTIPVI